MRRLALMMCVVGLVGGPARAAVSPAALREAEQRIAPLVAARSGVYPPQTIALVALKDEGRLELWADGGAGWRFVRSYLVLAASGQLGPKLRQGDHQVPEGVYRIAALNPNSRYHLSLRVDYPNAVDQLRARDDGRAALGGDIMVHGDAVSDGCLPVGDDAVEELFALTSRIGTEHVEMIISPLDLRRVEPRAALARLQRPPSWVGDLYAQLAASLRAFPLPPEHEDVTPPPGRRLRVARSRCRPYDAADCTRRCSRGETGSCARAGLLYRDGRRVARDTAKAWSLLSKACTGGDAFGCGALAELYLDDDGSRRSVARSADLARGACDGGDGHACAHLAELCTEHLAYPGPRTQCTPQQVERLHAQAVALLEGSCDGWAAYDCHTLARMYANDERGGASALRFATRSCAAGDPGGCDALAQLREDDGDIAGAHELYAQACRNGYARACGRARRLPVRTIVTSR